MINMKSGFLISAFIVFTGFVAAQTIDTTDIQQLKEKVEKLEKAKKQVSISGQIFGAYSYSTFGTNGKDANKFDMERSFLTVRVSLSDSWATQITTDLYRGSDTNTYYKGLGTRMRFIFLEHNIDNWQFRFGMIPGLFYTVEELGWKYRGIAQTPTDRYSFLTTGDFGIFGTYKLPSGYGEVSATLVNGRGFTNFEADKYKDIGARFVLYPFVKDPVLKPLMVAGFGYKGYENGRRYSGLPKNRYGIMSYYVYDIVSLGVIYAYKTDAPSHPDTTQNGALVSVFGEIKSPWEVSAPFSFVWRYDRNDPNTLVDKDAYDFIIAGITYKPNPKITFALDYQGTIAQSKTLRKVGGGFVDYDARYYVHVIVYY